MIELLDDIPDDYYPPKDLANAIWGQCFDYKDIEQDDIRNRVVNTCFIIEKIYKAEKRL